MEIIGALCIIQIDFPRQSKQQKVVDSFLRTQSLKKELPMLTAPPEDNQSDKEQEEVEKLATEAQEIENLDIEDQEIEDQEIEEKEEGEGAEDVYYSDQELEEHTDNEEDVDCDTQQTTALQDIPSSQSEHISIPPIHKSLPQSGLNFCYNQELHNHDVNLQPEQNLDKNTLPQSDTSVTLIGEQHQHNTGLLPAQILLPGKRLYYVDFHETTDLAPVTDQTLSVSKVQLRQGQMRSQNLLPGPKLNQAGFLRKTQGHFQPPVICLTVTARVATYGEWLYKEITAIVEVTSGETTPSFPDDVVTWEIRVAQIQKMHQSSHINMVYSSVTYADKRKKEELWLSVSCGKAEYKHIDKQTTPKGEETASAGCLYPFSSCQKLSRINELHHHSIHLLPAQRLLWMKSMLPALDYVDFHKTENLANTRLAMLPAITAELSLGHLPSQMLLPRPKLPPEQAQLLSEAQRQSQGTRLTVTAGVATYGEWLCKEITAIVEVFAGETTPSFPDDIVNWEIRLAQLQKMHQTNRINIVYSSVTYADTCKKEELWLSVSCGKPEDMHIHEQTTPKVGETASAVCCLPSSHFYQQPRASGGRSVVAIWPFSASAGDCKIGNWRYDTGVEPGKAHGLKTKILPWRKRAGIKPLSSKPQMFRSIRPKTQKYLSVDSKLLQMDTKLFTTWPNRVEPMLPGCISRKSQYSHEDYLQIKESQQEIDETQLSSPRPKDFTAPIIRASVQGMLFSGWEEEQHQCRLLGKNIGDILATNENQISVEGLCCGDKEGVAMHETSQKDFHEPAVSSAVCKHFGVSEEEHKVTQPIESQEDLKATHLTEKPMKCSNLQSFSSHFIIKRFLILLGMVIVFCPILMDSQYTQSIGESFSSSKAQLQLVESWSFCLRGLSNVSVKTHVNNGDPGDTSEGRKGNSDDDDDSSNNRARRDNQSGVEGGAMRDGNAVGAFGGGDERRNGDNQSGFDNNTDRNQAEGAFSIGMAMLASNTNYSESDDLEQLAQNSSAREEIPDNLIENLSSLDFEFPAIITTCSEEPDNVDGESEDVLPEAATSNFEIMEGESLSTISEVTYLIPSLELNFLANGQGDQRHSSFQYSAFRLSLAASIQPLGSLDDNQPSTSTALYSSETLSLSSLGASASVSGSQNQHAASALKGEGRHDESRGQVDRPKPQRSHGPAPPSAPIVLEQLPADPYGFIPIQATDDSSRPASAASERDWSEVEIPAGESDFDLQ